MVFLNLRACAASARQAAFAQLNPHQQVGFDRIEASMQSGGIRHSAPFDARLTAFGMTPRRCEPGTKTSASESALLRESLCFWARQHYVQQARWLLHAGASFSGFNLIKRISARHCFTQTDL